jgi:hypothetical protein
MTRKERKGYLRADSFGQTRADSPHPLELASAAKWAKGIAVGDDSCGQRRPNTSERLDLGCAGDVEIDNRLSCGRGLVLAGRGVKLRARQVVGALCPLLPGCSLSS